MDITLVEVGPRDGLQNEAKTIPTELKVKFINALAKTGLTKIEATSFVSPKWVPQLADHTEVMQQIKRHPEITYSALVPNTQGFSDAVAAKTQQIAVFISASETFSQKNINCSIAESLEKAKLVIEMATAKEIPVRGYLSCVLGCPFEGDIKLNVVAELAEQLIKLGCYEVSLGDTIGIGTANQAKQLIKAVKSMIPVERIAVHFHDTYAQALTNIYESLDLGVTTIDSAVSGLGGCPYAPGAGGNVATEDVVYMLKGLGLDPGIDLQKLTSAGKLINDFLEQPPHSKVAIATLAKIRRLQQGL